MTGEPDPPPRAVEVMPFHQGAEYLDCLARLHEILAPRRYLEIGVWHGDSLARATCVSLAVDPDFDLQVDVLSNKPACHFYRETSDAFFATTDPVAILGGAVDLAFLDGLHRFETLLRDFANAERICHRQSVIALHDCLPVDPRVTNRSDDPALRAEAVVPGWWAGDVWKVPVLLRRYRPDLRLLTLDAPPTGLVLITGLDPANRVINEHYATMVEELMETDLAEFGTSRLFDLSAARPTRLLDDANALREALFGERRGCA